MSRTETTVEVTTTVTEYDDRGNVLHQTKTTITQPAESNIATIRGEKS